MVEATVNTEEWALRLNKELTEARTRIAALEERLAEKVKVKPLAWRDGKFEAPCIFGLYVVVRHANRFRASLCHTLADGTQSNDVFDEFDYSEDALPRIQADYERRILSALEATPPAPKVTDVETVIAAASEYCWQRYKGRDPLNLKSPAVFTSHEHQKIAEHIRAALTAAQESGE